MQKVYDLLDPEWHDDIRLFTENEFSSIVHIDGEVTQKSSEDINREFNHDKYRPRDGALVKAADEICAFVEAYTSTQNGISAPELGHAMEHIRDSYQGRKIAGISFDDLFSEFQ